MAMTVQSSSPLLQQRSGLTSRLRNQNMPGNSRVDGGMTQNTPDNGLNSLVNPNTGINPQDPWGMRTPRRFGDSAPIAGPGTMNPDGSPRDPWDPRNLHEELLDPNRNFNPAVPQEYTERFERPSVLESSELINFKTPQETPTMEVETPEVVQGPQTYVEYQEPEIPEQDPNFYQEDRPTYTATDLMEVDSPTNALSEQVQSYYENLLAGNDPIAEQNQNMAITALDRMQKNADESTARQAQELGIPVGSQMYNEMLEKNREAISSQGSGVLSDLARDAAARRQNALAQAGNFAKGQQQFGLDFAKVVENINRYGYESALRESDRKDEWTDFIMKNPDLFNTSEVGEAKKRAFATAGLDPTQLVDDPHESRMALNNVKEWLRTTNPTWSEEQLDAEARKRVGQMSPYTNELYSKVYQQALDEGMSENEAKATANAIKTGDTSGFNEAQRRIIAPFGIPLINIPTPGPTIPDMTENAITISDTESELNSLIA